jgi:hypothetical protein
MATWRSCPDGPLPSCSLSPRPVNSTVKLDSLEIEMRPSLLGSGIALALRCAASSGSERRLKTWAASGPWSGCPGRGAGSQREERVCRMMPAVRAARGSSDSPRAIRQCSSRMASYRCSTGCWPGRGRRHRRHLEHQLSARTTASKPPDNSLCRTVQDWHQAPYPLLLVRDVGAGGVDRLYWFRNAILAGQSCNLTPALAGGAGR